MEIWHEQYLYKGNLVRSKGVFQYCVKCGMKIIGKASNTFPYCLLCFHKVYKDKREIRNTILGNKPYHCGESWYGEWKGKEEGYEYRDRIVTACLYSSILCCKSLNKTPKIPDYDEACKTGKLREFLYDYFPKFWVDKFVGRYRA